MKTVEDRAKFFKQCVMYYFYEKFHMYQWELIVGPTKDSSVRGQCFWHDIEDGAQQISIYYNESWLKEKDTTLHEIEKVAFHEVMEACLSGVRDLITNRYILEREVDKEIHNVIRLFENVMFTNEILKKEA